MPLKSNGLQSITESPESKDEEDLHLKDVEKNDDSVDKVLPLQVRKKPNVHIDNRNVGLTQKEFVNGRIPVNTQKSDKQHWEDYVALVGLSIQIMKSKISQNFQSTNKPPILTGTSKLLSRRKAVCIMPLSIKQNIMQ